MNMHTKMKFLSQWSLDRRTHTQIDKRDRAHYRPHLRVVIRILTSFVNVPESLDLRCVFQTKTENDIISLWYLNFSSCFGNSSRCTRLYNEVISCCKSYVNKGDFEMFSWYIDRLKLLTYLACSSRHSAKTSVGIIIVSQSLSFSFSLSVCLSVSVSLCVDYRMPTNSISSSSSSKQLNHQTFSCLKAFCSSAQLLDKFSHMSQAADTRNINWPKQTLSFKSIWRHHFLFADGVMHGPGG